MQQRVRADEVFGGLGPPRLPLELRTGIAWGDDLRESELNNALGDFAAFHISGRPCNFTPFTSMGVFRDGKIIAAMIYHNLNRRTGVIELSGAASDKRWLTRPVLREMYAYPFGQLACQRGSERYEAQERMLTAYGFKAHRIERLRGRDEAEILFTLTAEAWRANRFNRQEVRLGR